MWYYYILQFYNGSGDFFEGGGVVVEKKNIFFFFPSEACSSCLSATIENLFLTLHDSNIVTVSQSMPRPQRTQTTPAIDAPGDLAKYATVYRLQPQMLQVTWPNILQFTDYSHRCSRCLAKNTTAYRFAQMLQLAWPIILQYKD